ncbi:MAG: CAP domain-containing protein [Clostridium sp.]|nr:CAP domain-containing protein [Clostridium sp.]
MRKNLKKRVCALTVGAMLGFGLFNPVFLKPGVRAAGQDSTETEEWEVTTTKSETSTEQNIGEAADREHEENPELFVDETELAGVGTQAVSGTKDYAQAYEVLGIVNQRRAEEGLSPLVMDRRLTEAAMTRAAEIVVSFSHTRPCGLDCFSVSQSAYGENIAYGYQSSAAVMNAWMNSTGHRNNIMKPGYESVGIGCFYHNGVYYWVQLFGYDAIETSGIPENKNVTIDVVVDAANYELKANDIIVMESDPRYGFIMFLQTNAVDTESMEYSWYASNNNGETWMTLSDWEKGADGIIAIPSQYGDYVIVGKARKAGDNSTVVQYATTYGYHPAIKGICQMPYTGEGGGYLIGIESYDNPNHAYRYEMLILDCTLLAQGKDAWIYTTGQCYAPDTCLWTIWQPLYGYYWTLFRIYDENGKLIDEQCFGFENIC